MNATIFTQADMAALDAGALAHPRRRLAQVISQPEDSVQRLANCLTNQSYSRPHRFRGPQSIAVLRGRLAVMVWKTPTEVPEILILQAGEFVDVPGGPDAPYHALVCTDDSVIIFEALSGPYRLENREDLTDGFPPEVGQPGGDAPSMAEARATMLAAWKLLVRLHLGK